MSGREARTAAEWTTFAGSCLVLLLLIGLIAVRLVGDDQPAAPVARVVGTPTQVGAQHHVEVTVTNEGDTTAANVQVSAELEIDGTTSSADQTIDFLAGDEVEDLVFVFADDPADGELTVTVTGFSVP